MRRSLLAVALLAGLAVGTASCGGSKHPAARVASSPASQFSVTAYVKQTVTLRWTTVPGATGYQLSRDGVVVSTAGAAATKATFLVAAGTHTLAVSAILPAPPPPTTTAATTTATTTTAPPQIACWPNPVGCGFPGPGINDGVPPGTTLKTGLPPGTTANGTEIDVNTAGTVIDGYHLTQRLQINAPGVHFVNSLVEVPGVSGQTGVAAIGVTAGLTGIKISDVECRTSNSIAIEACIASGANVDVTVTRPYFHGCADCVETYGHIPIDGGWIASDLMQPNDHVEPIYVSGTGGSVTVTHSVLYNPQNQTAVLFVDNYLGQAHASASDSLFDGGGWTTYAHVDLTNVREARCLTPSVPAPNGGSACTNGPDANGTWPNGGYFGPNTPCPPSATWSNVVWDASGAPIICAAGAKKAILVPHAGRPQGAAKLLASLTP